MSQEKQMLKLLKELEYYMNRKEFYDAGKIVRRSQALTQVDSIANQRTFENGKTPLMVAVEQACYPLVEDLLFTKPDLTIQDDNHFSVFNYAVSEP